MAIAECAREQAEKACQLADEQFLAGNIPGAHRHAKRAKRLCPSLPGVNKALAAYEIHLAAARGGGWRAILGMAPDAAAAAPTEDDVQKLYRRRSLLVHPDKSSCAAALDAFKLLKQARDDALAPPAAAAPDPRDAPPPTHAPAPRPAPAPAMVVTMMMQPARGPYERVLVYCPFCKNEFCGKVGRQERQAGMRCARCPAWLSPPWQKKPPAEKKPPAAPGRQVFRCPARCPECGAQYASMVCAGQWCLQCKACSKAAMVHVHGPGQATVSIKRHA